MALISSITQVMHLLYSVCGLIVPQEDLPFNDLGMCPDVVSDYCFFTNAVDTAAAVVVLVDDTHAKADLKTEFALPA